MKKVAIILAHGFEEGEAVIPADLMNRAGISILMTGLDGFLITGGHGITIEADYTLDELPHDLDGIFLPGGMPGSKNLADSDELISLIKQMHNDSKMVAAICAAPAVVLSKTGILDGRRFTCYPGFEKEVSGALFVEESVVSDGNIITSRAIGTAGLLGLKIIEYLVDKPTASKIAKATLF
ncbi:MAG: DJ-1/PfpI family protein [Spirochaetaceae bacterium]|jgi:4-methyl-5(b-hydroxyethyl)-thiazole monophosphate biosynthesis|nr:DJ-1/PfpI family protein [Spirochaetaceae bacterium]